MTNQTINQARPLFALGQTLATPGALTTLEALNASPLAILSRHQSGDWGDLESEDKQSNEAALLNGGRIFSAYQFDAERLWVITEADRSATTILLPEEY